MGNSGNRSMREHSIRNAETLKKQPTTLNSVKRSLREAGLEASQLIVGIDFTKSNEWTGQRFFQGKSLHDISSGPNPYAMVLQAIAQTLRDYDNDSLIPCYGFGDLSTCGEAVFSFQPKNEPLKGLESLIERYKTLCGVVTLSGPTSFSPLIRQAIKDVVDSGMKFHVLLIVADGHVSHECINDTENAIVDACEIPLAIIVVGVGDGPWEEMQRFDKNLPKRPWDNFHFVECLKVFGNESFDVDEKSAAFFALHALLELPEQYKICRHLVGDRKKGEEVLERLSNALPNPRDPPH